MTWDGTFGNICPGATPPGGPHLPASTTDDPATPALEPPELMAAG